MIPVLNLPILAQTDQTIVFLQAPTNDKRGAIFVQIAPGTSLLEETMTRASFHACKKVMDNVYCIESSRNVALHLLTTFLRDRTDFCELVAALVPDALWGVFFFDRPLALHNAYTDATEPAPSGLAETTLNIALNDERAIVLRPRSPLTAHARFVLNGLAEVGDEVVVTDSGNAAVVIETVIESDQVGAFITKAADSMRHFSLPVTAENELNDFTLESADEKPRFPSRRVRPPKSDDGDF